MKTQTLALPNRRVAIEFEKCAGVYRYRHTAYSILKSAHVRVLRQSAFCSNLVLFFGKHDYLFIYLFPMYSGAITMFVVFECEHMATDIDLFWESVENMSSPRSLGR
jgi:hypothetical protein